MKKLFIVIVTYNPDKEFGNLLQNLIEEKVSDYKMEMVIVDNGKTELKNKSYDLRIIKNKQNLGFAAGCNLGIKYSLKNGADAVLLLNQDVVVEKVFLQPLINNSADIVSPVIKFRRKTQWVYDYGGRINWWWGRTYHIEKSSKFKVQSSKLRQEIDYISGCCMLVRRQVFEKIGLFDEKYFLYFEDADFCLRAGRAGLTYAVETGAIITHNLIEGREKPFKQQLELIKSNFIFINKYLGFKKLFGYLYLAILAFKIFFGGRTSQRGPTS